MTIKNVVFLTDKQYLILKFCDNSNKSDINFNTKIMYSHVHDILKIFRSKKIISFRKVGRCQVIRLTRKGRELRDCYDRIVGLMG